MIALRLALIRNRLEYDENEWLTFLERHRDAWELNSLVQHGRIALAIRV